MIIAQIGNVEVSMTGLFNVRFELIKFKIVDDPQLVIHISEE